MGIIESQNIRTRLISLVGISVAGFVLFGILAFYTLNQLKVNGPLYKRIVQGKDLIADVLPPPEYIIETYLVTLQLVDEIDPIKRDNFISYVRKNLKEPYDVRHEFWVKDLPEKTDDDRKLKNFMVVEAKDAAIKFYEILENEFFPLIMKGERDKARELVRGVLKENYDVHRRAIDEVVSRSTIRNANDESSARKTIAFMSILLLIIGLSVIIFVVILCVLLIRQITLPLAQVVDVAEKVAKGDLTSEKVKVYSNDEIGRLGNVFNKLLDSLHEIFSSVRATSEGFARSSEGLSSSSEEMNAITLEISNAILNVAKGASTQVDKADKTSAAMEKATITLKQAVADAQATSLSVTQASERTHAGKVAAQESVAKIIKLTDTVVSTAKVIKGLGEKSQAIGEITNTITSIADQTNLLALNAAIEAARAGEAGRGFAVVAEEVRKLAEGSADAVRKIGNLIRAIQSETLEAVNAIEISSREVNEGRVEITKINESLDDINKAVQEINVFANKISTSMQQQVIDSQLVAKSIDEVFAFAKESAASAEEVSSSTQEQTASMEEMSASAQELSQQAITLKNMVAKFKLGNEVNTIKGG